MLKEVFHILWSTLFGNKFFDIKNRASLLEFWTIFIVYGVLPFLLIGYSDLAMYFIVFLSPWIIWSVFIRRFHDLGMRGWWILLIFPLLLVAFIGGEKQDNKYGRYYK